MTAGAVGKTVVKLQASAAAMGTGGVEVSVTPVLTVMVKVVEWVSGPDGVNVAVLAAAL